MRRCGSNCAAVGQFAKLWVILRSCGCAGGALWLTALHVLNANLDVLVERLRSAQERTEQRQRVELRAKKYKDRGTLTEASCSGTLARRCWRPSAEARRHLLRRRGRSSHAC